MKRSPYAKKGPEEEEFYDYNTSFMYQNVQLSRFIFLPEGMEALFIALYMLVLPYLSGLVVIYFFIAEGNFEHFLVLDLLTVLPVWSIGYEALAVLILLKIVYSAVGFQVRRRRYMARHNHGSQESPNHAVHPDGDLLEHYKQNY